MKLSKNSAWMLAIVVVAILGRLVFHERRQHRAENRYRQG